MQTILAIIILSLYGYICSKIWLAVLGALLDRCSNPMKFYLCYTLAAATLPLWPLFIAYTGIKDLRK